MTERGGTAVLERVQSEKATGAYVTKDGTNPALVDEQLVQKELAVEQSTEPLNNPPVLNAATSVDGNEINMVGKPRFPEGWVMHPEDVKRKPESVDGFEAGMVGARFISPEQAKRIESSQAAAQVSPSETKTLHHEHSVYAKEIISKAVDNVQSAEPDKLKTNGHAKMFEIFSISSRFKLPDSNTAHTHTNGTNGSGKDVPPRTIGKDHSKGLPKKQRTGLRPNGYR